MSFNTTFDVEIILGKKVQNGKVKYLVKWCGFPYASNEWVDINDCMCDENIAEFESQDLMGIIGCTKTHRGVKYAVISKGKRVFTLVNSIEMIEKHPIYLLHFLQSRVEFDNQRSVVIGDIVNSLTPIGPPKILGITNLNEIFKYWVEYDTLSGETARKILTEQHVKANIDSNLKPIVNYMESRMVFPFGPQESDSFKLTEAMKKKMEEMDVATQVKILVPRNSGLVGHLLYNPVAAIRNRRLLSMQNSNVSNVHNYTRTSMGHFGASTSGMTSVPASTLDHSIAMSVVNEDDDDAVNAVSNNVPVEQFDDDLDDLAISELFDNLNINETGDESGSVYEYVVNLFNHENEFIQQFEATEVDNDLMIAPLFEEIDTHEAHNDFNHVNDLNIGDGGIENESAFQNVENSELSAIPNVNGNSPSEHFEGEIEYLEDAVSNDSEDGDGGIDGGVVGGGVEIFNNFDPFMRQANLAFALQGRPRASSMDSRRPEERKE